MSHFINLFIGKMPISQYKEPQRYTLQDIKQDDILFQTQQGMGQHIHVKERLGGSLVCIDEPINSYFIHFTTDISPPPFIPYHHHHHHHHEAWKYEKEGIEPETTNTTVTATLQRLNRSLLRKKKKKIKRIAFIGRVFKDWGHYWHCAF